MFICCHNFWDYDIINNSQTRVSLLFYDEFFTSLKIRLYENNLIEIILIDTKQGMNNWKIKIINNKVVCANVEKGTLFRMEKIENGYFNLIDIESNLYLMQNTETQRDPYSYYLILTSDKLKASEFKFELNND